MSKINFSCDKYLKIANLLNELFKKSCAIRRTMTYLYSTYVRIKGWIFLPIFCRYSIGLHVSISNIFDQFFGQKSANILIIVLWGVFSQWFGFGAPRITFRRNSPLLAIGLQSLYNIRTIFMQKKQFLRK